mgnify:CR=1 FL=1
MSDPDDFNLTSKRISIEFEPLKLKCMEDWLYEEKYVKEFIKRLKEEAKRWMLDNEYGLFETTIDQLAGEKLINN